MTALYTDEARTLLASVRQHPDDRQQWLVLADWLQDHGDARGQIIAWDQRLAHEALPADERKALQRQLDALTQANRAQWLAGLSVPAGAGFEWQYGFVVGVTLRWNARTLPFLASLRAHLTGALLRSLDLRNRGIGVAGTAALAASPHLAALEVLELSYNRVGDGGAAALADCPHLTALKTLSLSNDAIGDAGAAALAASPHTAALEVLDLHSNHIGSEGAASLAASAHLAALTELSLYANRVGDEGAAALAASPHLAALKTLNLGYNAISAEGAAALAASAARRGCRMST